MGESKVMYDLLSQDYQVFFEFGDNSKTDLIALGQDYNPIKIQVKSYMSVNGSVSIGRNKCGPNYSFDYTDKHFDVLALYIIDHNIIAYISAKEFFSCANMITIRAVPPKNNQKKGVRLAKNYTSFSLSLTP